MSDQSLLTAAALGLLEGLTEFLPVSSTGHLLLAGHFLGFESAGRAFEIVIQLGAVLAILSVYAGKLWRVFSTAHRDPEARRFIIAVAIAFLPAALIGVLAHGFIKNVLFETPMLIAINLIIGGVILLFVDKWVPAPRYDDAMDVPLGTALGIGLFQCLAMIPGVSRSGATIVGALTLGVGKRGAAEFSFFLSMPTMAAAVAYDLWKNRDVLDGAAWAQIGIGFLVAFLAGAFVVKSLLGYVSRHGYALFGWWRIAVGVVALAALFAGL